MASKLIMTIQNFLIYFDENKGYGFILYMTRLEEDITEKAVLNIPSVHDRAYVQIGNVRSKPLVCVIFHIKINETYYLFKMLVGVVNRNDNKTRLKIDSKINKGTLLYIFVESTGRMNYGNNLFDQKVNACLIKLKSLLW